MSDERRVQELLDELLDRDSTPEQVCSLCLELLPVVRERWRQICLVRAELDALLPVCLDGNLPTMPQQEVPQHDLSLPQVPGYEVEAVLGRGGMGVVFRARQLRLRRLVALKMTLAGSYASPQERERFRREAEAVAALRHANIVQIHDIGDWAGRSYFTMELIEGGSLAHRLAGEPQPAREAAALVATLAEAMYAAHREGIVHRDLKPANILITPEGTPKITDFGLALRLEGGTGLTLSGVPIGTPNYMAPEQARGQSRTVGTAVDVYALGAILYELLTGRSPFRAETPAETLRQVIHQEPFPPARLNAKVPRDVETVCLKCLRKEPEQRYSSARELADDLGRFMRGEPVLARPVGSLERAAKWTRRNPTVAILSAVVVVALVAGTVVSVLFGIEARQKAGELERQSIQLQDQTRAAQRNAQRAVENEKEATKAMLAGLLIPIDDNPLAPWAGDELGVAEAEALLQLRAKSAPLRVQFLELALDDPRTARQVGRRADWVVQAIVGCDRNERANVERLVVRRIQEPGAPQDVTLACARLGLALNIADRAWAERSAEALVKALREPTVGQYDYPPLAKSLTAVSERLPPDQAPEYAAQVTDALLTRLQNPSLLRIVEQLAQAVEAVGPRLDAAAATRAAGSLTALIRRPGSRTSDWPSLSKALVAVCQQLPPSDSASYLNETVDFIIAAHGERANRLPQGFQVNEMADLMLAAAHGAADKLLWGYQARALSALGGGLDAAGVARVAEAILGMLGQAVPVDVEFAMAELVEHLDPEMSDRIAEKLVLMLRTTNPTSVTTTADQSLLVSACRRLDTAGTARVGDAILAAIRNPRTSILGKIPFAEAFVVLCGQLDPARVASLEDALIDALVADLADAKSLLRRPQLAAALAFVSGRPGAMSAARAAHALAAALCDPQTRLDFPTLQPLAEALAVVNRQLPTTEAALHANRAVAALRSRSGAQTAPRERAAIAAAMWTILDPGEARTQAARTADELENAIRKEDISFFYSGSHNLAEALAAIYGQLDPAERVRRTNAAANALIAALRRPGTEIWSLKLLADALTVLCRNLDRPGAVRIADDLLTVLGETDIRRLRFEFPQETYKNVAVRLEEPDLQRLLDHPLAAGRVQRAILDVLGEAKHRTFRNTWDYLDWAESHRN